MSVVSRVFEISSTYFTYVLLMDLSNNCKNCRSLYLELKKYFYDIKVTMFMTSQRKKYHDGKKPEATHDMQILTRIFKMKVDSLYDKKFSRYCKKRKTMCDVTTWLSSNGFPLKSNCFICGQIAIKCIRIMNKFKEHWMLEI